jgi:mRNA interferase MazF
VGLVSWPRRFEVWLISLDPTRGSEIRKTRPCVVVSPDELNRNIETVIVAPMTTATRAYPTRVRLRFEGRDGEIVLDQIRTVDRTRLLRRLGALPRGTARRVCDVLGEMFAWD